MLKIDCHFYGVRSCKALTKLICNTKPCSFYITEQQFQENNEKYPPIDYSHYKGTGEKYRKRRAD